MGLFLGTRIGTVAVLSGSSRLHDQLERRTGFSQVLEEDFRNLRWVAEPDFTEDDGGAGLAVQGLLARHTDLVGVYVTGGGIAGIASTLQESGDKERVVLSAPNFPAKHPPQLPNRESTVSRAREEPATANGAGLPDLIYRN